MTSLISGRPNTSLSLSASLVLRLMRTVARLDVRVMDRRRWAKRSISGPFAGCAVIAVVSSSMGTSVMCCERWIMPGVDSKSSSSAERLSSSSLDAIGVKVPGVRDPFLRREAPGLSCFLDRAIGLWIVCIEEARGAPMLASDGNLRKPCLSYHAPGCSSSLLSELTAVGGIASSSFSGSSVQGMACIAWISVWVPARI